jgi:hypothetical protein
MRTFTAQIIYSIECDGRQTDQYEEQWRLVFADDEHQALSQARAAASSEESTFVDRHGRTICWRLLAVKDIQPVELVNGGLLFSQVREAEMVPAPIWAA